MPPAPKAKLSGSGAGRFHPWIKHGDGLAGREVKLAGSDPRRHWAFQPVLKPALPALKNQDWSANPIDAFILARLEAKGLTPNPPADPRTLLRRV